MTQRSFHWNAASLGDADALTVNAADGIGFRLANEDYESPFVDTGLRMVLNGDENRGVLKNWLNELVVAGVGTPITVATGGAVVYGMPYENTAVVNVAVAAPTTDTRQDHIVLRRDWTAQTIRVTRIVGVEGGSIPAITQSPAPDGTGIYDIPLATISVTTGGVITVTDAREFCRYGTGIRDDAFSATHLTNNTIDWADRSTTTKRMFIGGGDLHPMLNAGRFSYVITTSILMAGAPVWDGAANEEAWQHTGVGYRGTVGTFRTPPDYASGTITAHAWWVNNVAVAASFYVRCYITGRDAYWTSGAPYSSNSEYITSSGVVSDVFRTEAGELSPSHLGANAGIGGIWNFWLGLYNTAGAEDIGIMGLELEYTGYV